MPIKLQARQTNGGRVSGDQEDGYHLSLPKLSAGTYGLAQLDNYAHLHRREFPHRPPLRLRLKARVSQKDLPGTWGFGLWNDPFSFGFGGGGMARVLPVLPNAAWFFYGSAENHLSLRDDQPGSGFHAKTFRSTRLHSVLPVLAAPSVPLLLWPVAARFFRQAARLFVKEETESLAVPVDRWHIYELLWRENQVTFTVDDRAVLSSGVSPQGRLGLVIWIDNQYFRFDPSGKLGFGFLETQEEGWLQVQDLSVTMQS